MQSRRNVDRPFENKRRGTQNIPLNEIETSEAKEKKKKSESETECERKRNVNIDYCTPHPHPPARFLYRLFYLHFILVVRARLTHENNVSVNTEW